jgi:hypothetical protein
MFGLASMLAGLAFGFQAADRPTGMIAGQVVNQATGAALKGAIARLRYINPSGGDETMVRQTNDAGRFEFTGLWGRDWELSAECSGYVTALYGASRYAPRGRFVLEKNQQIKDIVLKLVPQSVVTGRVLDPDGKPVEGAHVSLLKAGYRGGVERWREVASVLTLDNGEYRIARVAAGRYLVRGTLPVTGLERMPSESGTETGYADTYHPHATEVSLAAPVDVADGGEVRGIDVQLVPTRVFHVRGKLQSASGWRNVSGHVALVDPADQSRIVASVRAAPPDLVFDIERIPPGSYLVAAGLDATPVYLGVQPVDVTARDVEGLVLNLGLVDALAGVLKLKSDDQKADLRKVSLRAAWYQVGMVPIATFPVPIKIADDLSFRTPIGWTANFAGFGVSVSDLPDNCYVASMQYGGRDVPEAGIEFTAGATLAITIGADGGHVDGVTLGQDDQRLGGAVVGLFAADGKGAVRTMQADAAGGFQFRGVPPGDYRVIAWEDVSRDDLENPAFVKRFDNQAAAISVAAGGASAVSLKAAAQ